MKMPKVQRRAFLQQLAMGSTAMAAASGGRLNGGEWSGRQDGDSWRRKVLAQPAFRPLPPGAVRAEGWLRRQLQQQADGLTGHLDEFWPDVSESQWFGGKAEGWERAPYWLDGLVALAWALDDEGLKQKARRRVGQIVAGQRSDGWYAPFPADANARTYDLWAILLVNKVLVQYHAATGEDSVLQAVMANLRAMSIALDRTPLFDWGRFRWFEGLIAIHYVLERTGEPWLSKLARTLREQGFDYAAFHAGTEVTSPTPRRGLWTWEKHVVNTAMALKAGAMAWRSTRSEADRGLASAMLQRLDRYHGQANGMFSGDECLSGRNPVQGTELCAVVEAMYSLELAVAVGGDVALADRLERIAFNALPATFAPDMWSHQYDQQANQVQCTVNPGHMWSTNGPDSNLFGLEPNFGCCTANLHQGWPKFAAHLWMRCSDEGIAVVAYAPSSARFESRGVPVQATLRTDYPFRDDLRLTVSAERSVRFPLLLRVPSWAVGATIRVAGGAPKPLRPGTFHRLSRTWEGTTEIELKFPMPVVTTQRYHGAVSVERGPLVYALAVGENWTRIHADQPHRELPHGDFEVRPTTPWNYGLWVDETDPAASITFEERPVGERPFSPDGAGVVAKAHARRLPQWKLEHGWAAETPVSPLSSREAVETITLIPYGCAKLRVTEFPRLQS
jgi:hypothetical protein